jgi:hypothetical protein
VSKTGILQTGKDRVSTQISTKLLRGVGCVFLVSNHKKTKFTTTRAEFQRQRSNASGTSAAQLRSVPSASRSKSPGVTD